MSKAKRIPIKVAKDISNQFDLDQVIILTYDKIHNVVTVVTYGKTVESCASAAESGNNLKKFLGWPPELCNDQPSRVKKMMERIKELEEENEILRNKLEEKNEILRNNMDYE